MQRTVSDSSLSQTLCAEDHPSTTEKKLVPLSEPATTNHSSNSTESESEAPGDTTYSDTEASNPPVAFEPKAAAEDPTLHLDETGNPNISGVIPEQGQSNMGESSREQLIKHHDQGVILQESQDMLCTEDASFFTNGRIFQVSDAQNRHINHRTMITVKLTPHDSVVCLALCQHRHGEDVEDSFWKTHAKVYVGERPNADDIDEQNLIAIKLSPEAELLDNTFVNLIHPWTIKRTEVCVRRCGTMVDYRKFLQKHKKAYSAFLDQ